MNWFRVLRIISLSLFFTSLGLLYGYTAPRLKLFLLKQIQTQSRNTGKAEIIAEDLDFSLFYPGVIFKNVKVQPMGDLKNQLSPLHVETISVYINLNSLWIGRFEVGSIEVHKPIGNIIIKESAPKKEEKTKSKDLNIEISDLWKVVTKIPLKEFKLTEGEFRVRLQKQNVVTQLKNLNLNFAKTYQGAKLEFFGPDILLKNLTASDQLTPLGLTFGVKIDSKNLELYAFKATHKTSFLMARTSIGKAITLESLLKAGGRSMLHIELEELTDLITSFDSKIKLPKLAGTVNLQVSNGSIVEANLKTTNIHLGQFEFGDIGSHLKLQYPKLTASKIKLKNSAGNLEVEDFDMNLENEMKFSGRTLVKGMELRQLLIALGVGKTPLHLDITGRVPCLGSLRPLHLECAGEVQGRDFRVHTDENRSIVALKEFIVTASLVLDKEKIVFPKGLIAIGNSRGEARGEVSFSKGFNFKYNTEKLDFKDVLSLADLKYEGALQLSGSTAGNSDAATFDLSAKSPDFKFEDYIFGGVDLRVRYEKGKLYLSQIIGQINKSRYNGNATIQLEGAVSIDAKANLPTVDLEDLIYAFSRKVTLPFTAKGIGSGEIVARGPMSLSQLTYTVKSQVAKGFALGESFKNLQFNVRAKNGHAYADNVRLTKGEGRAILTGDVQPNGNMNIAVIGSDLRIADFETMRSHASGLDGNLNFQMGLRDFILKPTTALKASVSDATLNLDPLGDSQIEMATSPKSIYLKADIFNQKIKTSFTYPLVPQAPFHFKLDTIDWDFSRFLNLLVGSHVKHDYETSLTAHIDLNSKMGGLWDSSGQIKVPKLYVRHGTSQMGNPKPILISFENGLVKAESFSLEGDNTNLHISGARNKKDSLNFNINGQIDLSLLIFLTPFFKDMAGQLSLSTQVAGSTLNPDLLGSAYLKKGYVKLEEFAHPFEDLEADFLFSKAKIIVNRFKGRLGGGQLTAGGSITVRAYADIPVDIIGDLRQATLTIPEGLTTKGDLHYAISGNWFPYLFRADYNIDSGLYTRNFGDDVTETLIKRSAFLPKTILQKDFHPFDVDISTRFPKGLIAKNNILESEVRGTLQIKGNPRFPIFLGDIEAVPNGKILFRETPFTIETAKVKFSNPNENNPILYTVATTRVREWDISLLAQGSFPYKIQLSSSPPLSEQSIISLLALGVTDEETGDQASQGYQAGSVLLSQNPIQKELKKTLGVNVRMSQTVDDTRNVVTPRIIAEKQWTPKISTSYSRTIGDRISNEYTAEYKLNKHFSILGNFEQRDFDALNYSANSTSSNISTDILGVDLQYRVEFK